MAEHSFHSDHTIVILANQTIIFDPFVLLNISIRFNVMCLVGLSHFSVLCVVDYIIKPHYQSLAVCRLLSNTYAKRYITYTQNHLQSYYYSPITYRLGHTCVHCYLQLACFGLNVIHPSPLWKRYLPSSFHGHVDDNENLPPYLTSKN